MKNNKKVRGVTPDYKNSWGDSLHQQQHRSYRSLGRKMSQVKICGLSGDAI